MIKLSRLLVLSAIGFCAYHMLLNIAQGDTIKENPQIRSEVVQVEKGFGYLIWVGDKLLVKQEFIPAIKGDIPFQTHADAKKIAALVKSKLKNRTNPEITMEELGKLNIITLKP